MILLALGQVEERIADAPCPVTYADITVLRPSVVIAGGVSILRFNRSRIGLSMIGAAVTIC